MTLIFKIMDKATWKSAQKTGEFKGSKHDQRDGFIHFSTKEQLEGTLAKHYHGQKDLILLAFKDSNFEDNLKWEPSRGGALFPHLYAPLPTDTLLWEKPIEMADDGTHIIPDIEQTL